MSSAGLPKTTRWLCLEARRGPGGRSESPSAARPAAVTSIGGAVMWSTRESCVNGPASFEDLISVGWKQILN